MVEFNGTFSRRDFLKLVAAGALGLFLPDLPLESVQAQELGPDQQGRVLDGSISVFDVPSFKGKLQRIYWRDLVLPITGIAVSDDEAAHNRIWYRIGDQGYAYSGSIQPVRTVLNQPVSVLPNEGHLAEVTVPYADARWEANKDAEFAYRLYYETTHWVHGLVYDAQGNPWYRIQDDKWKFYYFVPAAHLRILDPQDFSPLSPEVPAQYKVIEVRLAQQLVIAYEENLPVYVVRTATGARFSNGNYSTPTGAFVTFHKRPYRHMAAGDIASNGYDLPGVPWVLYITKSGISFHGTYWHNDYGRPRSHGCINLTPQAARWFYRWTLPVVPHNEQFAYKNFGTAVRIID